MVNKEYIDFFFKYKTAILDGDHDQKKNIPALKLPFSFYSAVLNLGKLWGFIAASNAVCTLGKTTGCGVRAPPIKSQLCQPCRLWGFGQIIELSEAPVSSPVRAG